MNHAITALLVFATGCGYQDWRESDCFNGCEQEYTTKGEQGEPGTSVQGPKGDRGRPGPAPVVPTNGRDGERGLSGDRGPSGEKGSDGYSIVFESIAAVTCPTGGTTLFIAVDTDRSGDWSPYDEGQKSATVCNGLNGVDGEQGEQGEQGETGTAGTNGANGADAPPTQFTPVAIVDPCGDAPGIVDEVFLRLADGTLLASVSDNVEGRNTRFSLLVPGSWISTDGSLCQFTVSAVGEVTW